MAFALNELRNLLNRQTHIDGVVAEVRPGVVRVATANGVLGARYSEALSVGDRVRVTGGVATYLVKPSRTYSV